MGNDYGTLSEDEVNLRSPSIRRIEDPCLIEKFKKGAQYNMKVVLRGDLNTGKTCLWHRLQDHAFVLAHEPTPNIQIAHISWDYKATHDIVKVEVWDVVDKALNKQNNSQLSSGETFEIPKQSDVKEGAHQLASVDADTVDVMQGTHAVIFTFDPRRLTSWEYVKREIPKISHKVYVLVLANFRDLCTEAVKVTRQEILKFITCAGNHVRFLEISMQNCFGLQGVKSFLNLPFLRLKRDELELALQRNEEEFKIVMDELDLATNGDYEKFEKKQKNLDQSEPRPVSTLEKPRSGSPVKSIQSVSMDSGVSGGGTDSIQPPPVSSALDAGAPTRGTQSQPQTTKSTQESGGLFSPLLSPLKPKAIEEPQRATTTTMEGAKDSNNEKKPEPKLQRKSEQQQSDQERSLNPEQSEEKRKTSETGINLNDDESDDGGVNPLVATDEDPFEDNPPLPSKTVQQQQQQQQQQTQQIPKQEKTQQLSTQSVSARDSTDDGNNKGSAITTTTTADMEWDFLPKSDDKDDFDEFVSKLGPTLYPTNTSLPPPSLPSSPTTKATAIATAIAKATAVVTEIRTDQPSQSRRLEYEAFDNSVPPARQAGEGNRGRRTTGESGGSGSARAPPEGQHV